MEPRRTFIPRETLLLLQSLCLLTLLVGCASDPGGVESRLPAEHLGSPVTPSGELDPEFDALAWSADGSEIYYTSDPGNSGLATMKSVRIADGTIRFLDARPLVRGKALTVSANGQWICYQVGVPNLLECTSPAGQPTVQVTDHAEGESPLFGGNDSILAYGIAGPVCVTVFGGSNCDTLAAYNFRSQLSSRLLQGIPLAFAPDGDGLLYHERPCDERTSQNTCRTLELSLATGTSTPVWSGELDDHGQRWRWDAEGPRYVAWKGAVQDSIVIRRLASHTTDPLLQLTHNSDTLMGVAARRDQFAWSANGQRVAFWVGVTVPGPWQWLVLHVIDVPGRHDAAVAVVTSANAGGVAFSPDGQRVAYIAGTRIYTQSLP
jgi:hypothetical protein